MIEGPGTGAGRIVVGVDGSPPSQQALRCGAHLAAVFGAGLDAVTEHASCPVLVIHGDQAPPE
jgi:nucleotide-binding universal stress UspA family protein